MASATKTKKLPKTQPVSLSVKKGYVKEILEGEFLIYVSVSSINKKLAANDPEQYIPTVIVQTKDGEIIGLFEEVMLMGASKIDFDATRTQGTVSITTNGPVEVLYLEGHPRYIPQERMYPC
jgi:uncharacterized protein YrrD